MGEEKLHPICLLTEEGMAPHKCNIMVYLMAEVNNLMAEVNNIMEEEMLTELDLEESCQTQLLHWKQELGTHQILDQIAGMGPNEEVRIKKPGVDLILEPGKIQVEVQVLILNRNLLVGRNLKQELGIVKSTHGLQMLQTIITNNGQTMMGQPL